MGGQYEVELAGPGTKFSNSMHVRCIEGIAGAPCGLNFHGQMAAAYGASSSNYDAWNVMQEYTVPAGKVVYPLAMETTTALAGSLHKAAFKRRLFLGSGTPGNFTQLNTVPATRPALSNLYIKFGAGGCVRTGGVVVTITYTNQDGVTGRTVSITVPTHSAAGLRLGPQLLQDNDVGVRAVTDVTFSVAPTSGGIFTIGGDDILMLNLLPIAYTAQQYRVEDPEQFGVTEGEDVTLEFLAPVATSHPRSSWVKYALRTAQ